MDAPEFTRDDFARGVGKVAMNGSALEEVIYSVGEALRIDSVELRGMSGSRAATRVRQIVISNGLPFWAAGSPASFAEWASEAKGALAERNKVIHSVDATRMTQEGIRQFRVQTGRGREESPADLSVVETLGERLMELWLAGHELHTALLAMIAPKTYLMVWGPQAGTGVARYENGAWPARPTEDTLNRGWDWCGAVVTGADHRSIRVESPQGPRMVPPWMSME